MAQQCEVEAAARELLRRGSADWWELHPIMERTSIARVLKRHRCGPMPCPLHGGEAYLEEYGAMTCECTGEFCKVNGPLHLLAAMRKCSLEEALVELCRLFPACTD